MAKHMHRGWALLTVCSRYVAPGSASWLVWRCGKEDAFARAGYRLLLVEGTSAAAVVIQQAALSLCRAPLRKKSTS